MEVNLITEAIIGAAIEVHRELGPGLLESIYEEGMCVELASRRISFERQLPLSITYKGVALQNVYRLDLLVERKVIVELKSVVTLDAVFGAQLLTYLKITRCPVGLLINFNVPLLKNGVRRFISTFHSEPSEPPR